MAHRQDLYPVTFDAVDHNIGTGDHINFARALHVAGATRLRVSAQTINRCDDPQSYGIGGGWVPPRNVSGNARQLHAGPKQPQHGGFCCADVSFRIDRYSWMDITIYVSLSILNGF